MSDIKFGTDGWRALIAKDYTVDNVARVSIAVANWLNKNYNNPTVVLGHDCRFGGELFSQTVAKALVHYKIKVKMSYGFVSTPMVSLGVVKESADLGVVITASHNPKEWNALKFLNNKGECLSAISILDVINRSESISVNFP